MVKNVVTEIVRKKSCCGCGVCAGVSEGCLAMGFNRLGELVPSVINCNDCGLCLSVCPFWGHLEEDRFATFLGDYLKCYVGYSSAGSERSHGSSGGLATRVLKALLEEKQVTRAVVVAESENPERLFEPRIVSTPEEVERHAGSKYYPVEFSSIIQEIKKSHETFAIVGLPCVLRGLRLLQKKDPSFENKIKFLLGLTCGRNVNRNFTAALMKLAGLDPRTAQNVQYRCKEGAGEALDYSFQAVSNQGRPRKLKTGKNPFVNCLWHAHFFTLNACFHCRDLFAEHADISFMDAWLKPYQDDPEGTSIIVTRSAVMQGLLENELHNKRIFLEPIPEANVLDSQKGGLFFKKIFMERSAQNWGAKLSRKLSASIYISDRFGQIFGILILKTYFHLFLIARKLKIFSFLRILKRLIEIFREKT